jgi:hypothetical protein
MAITPLYTLSEIDAEISQAKLDLAAARKSLMTQFDGGGNSRRVERERVASLQTHLEWLQQQRANLQLGSAAGTQSHVGRPMR